MLGFTFRRQLNGHLRRLRGFFAEICGIPCSKSLARYQERDEITSGVVTADHFSPVPRTRRSTSATSRGLFYFAWGCFRDFLSGPAVHRTQRVEGAGGDPPCIRDMRSVGFALTNSTPTPYASRSHAS
jgi:hypothetical protein